MAWVLFTGLVTSGAGFPHGLSPVVPDLPASLLKACDVFADMRRAFFSCEGGEALAVSAVGFFSAIFFLFFLLRAMRIRVFV